MSHVGGTVGAMAGQMRERTPGVWELRVHLGRDAITKKRIDVSRTFRGGQRAAGKALAQLVAEADELRAERLGDPADGHDQMTVAELLARWQDLRAAEWSPTTTNEHAGTVRRWITPYIGDVSVVDLRRARIEEFYAKVARTGSKDGGPLSATSVRKIHTVLHAGLEDAVALELIAGNPSTKARRPKVTKHDARVPSLTEIRRAIDLADPDMATLIRVAIATGARRGELVALRWSDVDEDNATLHVQRSIVKLPGRPFEEKRTKTGAAAVLAIDAGTVEVLRAHRRRRQEQWLQLGRGRVRQSDWLWFDTDLRSPMPPDRVTYRWRVLADRAGLDGVRLHDLRHAAATHMVAAGIDIRTVAGRLRHASPAMTLDVYAGRDLGADRAAANTIGGLLDG
jgi:integrase